MKKRAPLVEHTKKSSLNFCFASVLRCSCMVYHYHRQLYSPMTLMIAFRFYRSWCSEISSLISRRIAPLACSLIALRVGDPACLSTDVQPNCLANTRIPVSERTAALPTRDEVTDRDSARWSSIRCEVARASSALTDAAAAHLPTRENAGNNAGTLVAKASLPIAEQRQRRTSVSLWRELCSEGGSHGER